MRGGSTIFRRLYRRIIRRIKSYDSKENKLIDLWLQGDIPKLKSIDDALEADYRRNPEKWQNPSIVSYYPSRDLFDQPKWESGQGGFMERFWWVAVIAFALTVSLGLIWGIINRAGA